MLNDWQEVIENIRNTINNDGISENNKRIGTVLFLSKNFNLLYLI